MKNMPIPYVIAVDGGGTSTRSVLIAPDGTAAAYERTFSSNPNDVGEAEAARRLAGTVSRLSDKMDERGVLLAVYAGVSGAVGHEKALSDAIRDVVGDIPVRVESDVSNLFGLDNDADAALICGTGSVCFVRTGSDRSELHRIGGWGYLLDTAGGGYAIGRDGLEAALAAADGRGDGTLLGRYAAEYLGGRPDQNLSKIYEGGKTFIAGFARSVFAAEREGDMTAYNVISRCVRGMTEYLECASRFIGEGKPFSCILSGGLTKEPVVMKLFRQACSEKELDVTFTVPELPQLAGAALNALKMAGVAPGPVFAANFMRTAVVID